MDLKPVLVSLIGALVLTMASALQAAPDVVVKGLFSNRAILVVNGQTHLVKAGDRTPEGILLISSTSREAVVEIDGERHTLGLSRHIAGSFSKAEKTEVRIPRSADSHYWVGGAINGRPVRMMVDTGASLIAMNIQDARRMGIDYRNGQRSASSTAGGIVETYIVELQKVSVGSLQLNNVQAAVVMGDFPAQILLGNSFLSRVSMDDEAGVMVLRNKF